MPHSMLGSTRTRVLVVEDQPHVREAVVELLALVDYDVLQAETLAQAVDLIDRADVVLLDLHLPDGNGLDLLKLCDDLEIPPQVVVITGYGTVSTAIQAMHAGAAAFLMKPVQPDDMLMMIRRAAQRHDTQVDLRFHHHLLRSIHAIMISADEAGRITYFNPTAEAVFGYTQAQAMGQPITRLVKTDPAREDPAHPQECQIFRHDGSAGVLLGSWSAVRGQPGHRLLTGRDITRDKLTEQDLVRKGTIAELTTLVASTLEEFDSPATQVTDHLTQLRETIERDDMDPQAAIQVLNQGIDEVNQMAQSIRSISDLLRSRMDEPSTVVDMAEVVRTTSRAVSSTQDGPVEILVRGGQDALVFGARGRLMTLVANLLTELIATLQGQSAPRPVVRVDVRSTQDDVIVELWDNGPGLSIAPHVLMHDPIGPPDLDAPGLGLLVARAIATEHAGRLYLTEYDGRGMALRLQLPKAPAAEE